MTEFVTCPYKRVSKGKQLPVGDFCERTGLSGAMMRPNCPIRRATTDQCEIDPTKAHLIPRQELRNMRDMVARRIADEQKRLS